MDASTGLVVNISAQKHQMRYLLLSQEMGPVVAMREKWRMYIIDFFFCFVCDKKIYENVL